jgi:hypothetical protein
MIAKQDPRVDVQRTRVKWTQLTALPAPGIQRAPPALHAGMAPTRTRMAKEAVEFAEMDLTVLAME